MSDSYKMFKVVSGEIIVGKVTGETSDASGNGTIDIEAPMVVIYHPTPQGQLAINLFPLNPFASKANESLPFKKSHIMFEVSEISDGVLKQYMEVTSGIAIVKAPKDFKIRP
jgi:hypothetical protein